MSRPSFSPREDAEILSMGVPDRELARRLGRKKTAIRDRRYHLRARYRRQRGRRSVCEALHERIVAAIARGRSLRDIAVEVGLGAAGRGAVAGYIRRRRLRRPQRFT